MDELTLEELLAQSIEAARKRRDESSDKREMSLVVTKLEEAALWLCEWKAREHNGDNSITDWLRGI